MKKTSNAMPSASAAKPAAGRRRKPAQAANNTAVAAAQPTKPSTAGNAAPKPVAKTAAAAPAKQAASKPNGQASRAAKAPVAQDKPAPVNGSGKPAQASAPQAAVAKPINGNGKPAEARGEKKAKKAKVVRDSFTMPESDYGKIAALKKQCLAAGLPVKKSELLRAGLTALSELPMTELAELIGRLENVKTGRPSKR
jgi:hypothetical protein